MSIETMKLALAALEKGVAVGPFEKFVAIEALRKEIAQPSQARETCEWTLDDEDSGTWSSSCGELWSFIDGGPTENRVTYCHHCGKLAAMQKGTTWPE